MNSTSRAAQFYDPYCFPIFPIWCVLNFSLSLWFSYFSLFGVFCTFAGPYCFLIVSLCFPIVSLFSLLFPIFPYCFLHSIAVSGSRVVHRSRALEIRDRRGGGRLVVRLCMALAIARRSTGGSHLIIVRSMQWLRKRHGQRISVAHFMLSLLRSE